MDCELKVRMGADKILCWAKMVDTHIEFEPFMRF